MLEFTRTEIKFDIIHQEEENWIVDTNGNNLEFNGGTSMDFLTNLDSETLKAELLAFLELGDDEFDISSMGEFEEQFV